MLSTLVFILLNNLFPYNQRTFPLVNAFHLSEKLITGKYIFFLLAGKFLPPKKRFSLIREIFYKEIFFHVQGSFPQAKIFLDQRTSSQSKA